MGWKHLFFGFDGRIGRQQFWVGLLALVIAQTINFLIIMLLYLAIYEAIYPNWSENLRTIEILAIAFPIYIIWFLMGLWPSLAIFTKRWHDRSKSGWWNLITPPLTIPTEIALDATFGVSGDDTGLLSTLIGLVYVVAFVWTLIELGFLRGTKGPNQYGHDPLAG